MMAFYTSGHPTCDWPKEGTESDMQNAVKRASALEGAGTKGIGGRYEALSSPAKNPPKSGAERIFFT